MSRTSNSLKNIMASVGGQVFAILAAFAARKCFLLFLSLDYLGLDSVFSNVLRMLSLFELGIGTAIVFSLYKPLAENDTAAIRALMGLYKKTYRLIGVAVLVCGLLLTPIVEVFVGTLPDLPHIRLIYMLFVLNSGLSYFFAYKRSLIIADQKNYITVLYHYAIYILMNILQIFILYFTKNYLLFLSLQIMATIAENLLIARKANRMYPMLREKADTKIAPNVRFEIVRNVKAMIFHRVGGIAVSATDNILISRLVSVAVAGLYSNYLMIINALNAILMQFCSSISASVGNLGAVADAKDTHRIFKNVNFFNFWIFSFVSISFFYMINPLISTIWLADIAYCFSDAIVLLIALNFYISGVRQPILTFKESFGLNWCDWYKPLLEAVMNLVVSILLGRLLGLAGIFIGTIATRLLISLWIEPVILYKNVFRCGAFSYYRRYFLDFLITAVLWLLTGVVIHFIPFTGIANFFIRLMVCLIVPNALLLLLFHKSEEFQFLLQTVMHIWRHLKKSPANPAEK